jgi:hypothetical protein
MHELVSQIGTRKKVKGIVEDYKKFLKANVAALRAKDVEPPEDKDDLPEVVADNLDVDEEHVEMFDKWDDVISKIKDKKLDEVNDKDLYDLQSSSRDFISSVGRDLQKAQKEGAAEKMAPNMDPSAVAKAADTEKMMPDLDKKAEKKAEKDE